MLAHNGEINTLRGNVNYMKAREGLMSSERFGKRALAELYPVVISATRDRPIVYLNFSSALEAESLPEVYNKKGGGIVYFTIFLFRFLFVP
jgi:glutamate synthase (NADPH/NADH)